MNNPLGKNCPRCQMLSPVDARFCARCGNAYHLHSPPSSPAPVPPTQMYPPSGAQFVCPPATKPARKWPIAFVAVAVIIAFWLTGTTFDFMTMQAAGRDAYADKLSQISGEPWAKWRQNADQFDSNVDRYGKDPATVTISTISDGRKIRIGVATVEKVSPWHWRAVDFVPDMPPYPTLPQ